MSKLQKILFFVFAFLFFFVPIVLWPFTSEVFEFNKIVLTYTATTLIVGVWAIRCITERKFIFRRTILDTPLLIFLGSQLISTMLSIDPGTSWLGYYSRFNGGLFSTIAYSILYWAFVSNFEAKEVIKLIYVTLASAFLVCLYAVLEHFGIDKSIWVQDVQSRVFSTLGQPNWLAAWVVALTPIIWAFILNAKVNFKLRSFLLPFALSILFFWTLIFTKSRSGLLGFAITSAIFWIIYFWSNRKVYQKLLVPFAIINSSFLIISLISGTQFTPSLSDLLFKSNKALPAVALAQAGPALEVGGTESGTIRKIVWKGALDIWFHYPIFGTGVETFAYSYYQLRPAEHNLVSEWDFIYNKAHNEFLNVAANTGTIGLIAYLYLIGASIFIFIKKLDFPISNFQFPIKSKNLKFGNSKLTGNWQMETGNLSLAFLAGYLSLLVTNFFGFSVVPTQIELFLFPAFAISLVADEELKSKNEKRKEQTGVQILGIISTLLLISYLLFIISRYWYADYLYSMGKDYNSAKRLDLAANFLGRAINLEANQALYHNELANTYTSFALFYSQQKDDSKTKDFTQKAINESQKAVSLSPANLNLKRSEFGVYIMLSTIDPNYILNAQETLIDAITYAPTDAKLYYNLGLTYARTGEPDKAMATLKKTIDLKANYKEARLAYAYLLIDKKQNVEAKAQLEYILTNVDPNDSLTKQALESIK